MDRFSSIDTCFVFVDTTGFYPDTHEIIGVATKLRGKPVQYVRFDPQSAPPGLGRINGYDPKTWNGLKPTSGAFSKIAKAMDGRVIVGHNLPFHLGFLKKSFESFGVYLPYTKAGMIDLMTLFTPLSMIGVVDGVSMDCLADSMRVSWGGPTNAKKRLEQAVVILDEYMEYVCR